MFFIKDYVDVFPDAVVTLENGKTYTVERLICMYEKMNDAEFESKHKRDEDGKFARTSGSSPSGEKGKKSLKHKPINGIIKRVEGFKNKPMGTYDLKTGKPKSYSSGYSVTFHQNEPDKDGKFKSIFGRYTPDEYDKLANELASEYDTEIDVGVFGNPEVSFHLESLKDAAKIAIKNNQHSIYCCKTGDLVYFSGYDKKQNPIEGI
ncbi:MAG: hypothetical protein J6S67_25305 [Methanobrevibacter sp.]|nr:hypothetical protein [Methanobrevibacter sp.]